MMYKKNLVAAVKVAGKVLRESSDRVVLPFGSEYSVLLKNLDSVRVQVKVSIDGKDATEGTWLVIEPNGSIELERFIRNGNLEKGNRFKFIERTSQIENARGIKVDDGLIRVEYKKELVQTVTTNIVRTKFVYDYDYYYWPYYRPFRQDPYRPYWYSGPSYNVNCTTSGLADLTGSVTNTSNVSSMRSSVGAGRISAMNCAMQQNDAGITVPGSESNQKFQSAGWFQTEAKSEILVLHLVGTTEKNKPVQKAVTVDAKPKCVTCGKVNKAPSKFCSQCGTALELI